MPKHVKRLPWLLLVRPNLGQPLLLSPGDLENFEITFAGTNEPPPHPNELLQMLQAPSSSQPARMTITLAQNGASVVPLQPKEIVSVMPYSRSDEHDPPRTHREHQYRTGFRWEARVRVGLDSTEIVRLGAYGWPRMFDIKWWHRRKNPSLLYHSVYVSNLHEESEINFLHVTDTHIAGRNDLIPEVLSETRDRHESRRLRLRYNNFNDNLRAVISFANKEKVDFVVLTGDLVDYYHDGILVDEDGVLWYTDYVAGERGERGGWAGKPAQADSNICKFVEIITGQDGRGESLKCPIFCIPGNHDYLRMEPPLALRMKFYILFFHRDIDKGPGNWGLDLQEAAEYEFWKGTKGDSHAKRLKRLRDGEGFDWVEFRTTQAKFFTTPEFDDTAQYLNEISYDTDFCVNVGPHRLVCINTGEDVCIPEEDFWLTWELVWDALDTSALVTLSNEGFWLGVERIWNGIDTSDLSTLSKCEKHFLDGEPHNRGILPSHLEMIAETVSESTSSGGLTFVFTHAPLVRERKPGDFDTSSLKWNMAGTLSEDEYCHFDSTAQDRNSIPGLDGSIAEWDSRILTNMVRWIQSGAGGVDAVFSGHSHDIKEYRLNKEAQVCSGKYSEGVSTTPTNDKEKWLHEHRPLQLISGRLKGPKREFRHVVIKDSHICSMAMREIPRLEQKGTEQIGFMFTKLSIDLARFGGYTSPNRNDLNPATHLDWANGVYHRLAVMWDLMEKYWLQLLNIEYLENMLQLEGYAGISQDLRKKLEQIDEALENASAQYARVVGKYPDIDWWYEPRDLDRRKSQFYAISIASLNLFGVDFGSSEKNSLDLHVHYQWSRHHWRSERLQDALEERIGRLFEFAHSGPLNLIAMWFASESVHLAPWASWDNPAHRITEPGPYLRWAVEQSRDGILADLCEKYEIVARYNYEHSGETGLKELYVYHSMRMAAWGASVGTLDEQPDRLYFEGKAADLKYIAGSESAWVDAIIRDLHNRIRRTGTPLVPIEASHGYTTDLYVESISTNPQRPSPGEQVEVTVTVRNRGIGTTAAFWIDWYPHLETFPRLGSTGERRERVSWLAPNATYTMRTHHTYSAPGEYHMYAQVDTEQEISEYEEQNNIHGPVLIHVASGVTDLHIERISTYPFQPSPGQEVEVFVTVRNRGAEVASGFWLDWYPHLETFPRLGLAGERRERVSLLPPSAAYTMRTRYTYTAPGEYHMYAQVDTEQEIREYEELNNLHGPVPIRVVSGMPDLYVQRIATRPLQPSSGQEVNVYVTVKNRGKEPAAGFWIDWYPHLETFPRPGLTGERRERVPLLAPDTTYRMRTRYTYAAPGEYCAYAQVDTDQEVGEYEEGNNIHGPVIIRVV